MSLTCRHCKHEFFDLEPTDVDTAGPPGNTTVTPGKMLGGFVIEQKIGTGAMGVVYRARQMSLDRTVALKILPPAFADNASLVKRFHEETSVLSALNHPNIVTIIDRGNVGKVYFFVMEHIDGPSLSSVMRGPVDVRRVVKIARETASALRYAHDRGIVHRDIKPSNIMLNSRGEVKVADFGLAGLMTQRSTHGEDPDSRPSRMGTPAYMSPEQKQDPFDVDGRTDIYSAGIVFYELLTGKRPELPMRERASQVCETADPRLDPIVARCLAEDPEARYRDAGELLSDLEEFSRELERAPRCPQCGELSPVRAETCVHCGADLSELFDICPECKQTNRREVKACLHCGVDLEKGRTLIANRVAMMLDQADNLRLTGHFEEAVDILDDVAAIDGRAFLEQRERARNLREKTMEEREAAARHSYEEAAKLVREHRFREANEVYRSIPKDVIDPSRAMEAARRLQEQLAAERRSKATINLALLALGLIMVMVGILLFVLR